MENKNNPHVASLISKSLILLHTQEERRKKLLELRQSIA